MKKIIRWAGDWVFDIALMTFLLGFAVVAGGVDLTIRCLTSNKRIV